MRFHHKLLAIVVMLVLPGIALASAVGRILFVHGEVIIQNADGDARQANHGADVFEGDKLISGPASSAQLKMIDDALLALRPNTIFRLDTYRFSKSQKDRAETSLLKGAVRAITGSIGKARKQSVRLRTPVATIGIRGTDFEAVYLGSDQGGITKGAYLRVYSGKGYMQTQLGVQFVSPDQTAYVSNRNQLPKILSNSPDFLSVYNQKGEEGNKEQEETQEDSPAHTDEPAAPEDLVDLELPGDINEDLGFSTLGQTDTASFSDSELTDDLNAKPQPEVPAVPEVPDVEDYLAQAQRQTDSRLGYVTLQGQTQAISDYERWNEAGVLKGLVDDSDVQYVAVSATQHEAEIGVGDAQISFGAWFGGWYLVSGDDVDEISSVVPYIHTDLLTPASLNKVGRYGFSAHTGEVFSSAGKVGILSSAGLAVDFTAQSVDLQLGAVFDSAQWNANASGSITDLTTASLPLVGQREAGGFTETATGSVVGMFVGSDYDGLMGTFDLAASNDQILGSYLFYDASLEDYLANATEQTDSRFGYLLNENQRLDISAFTRYGEGLLAALVDTGGQQWIFDGVTGEQTTLQAGDAEVVHGSRGAGWLLIEEQELSEQAYPVQYIHTDVLTPSSVSQQGRFQFSSLSGQALNSAGTAGVLNSGDLAVDFTDQSVDLQIGAVFDNAQWNASGSGSITDLTTASLPLAGEREANGVAEAATGSVAGLFVGSSYDGLMGTFDLATSSDQILGSYLFYDASLEDYLANATEQTDSRFGYLLNESQRLDIADFTRWYEEGELKGLVEAFGRQWVFDGVAGTESSRQVADAEVTFGSKESGWLLIEGQGVIEQVSPVQYIHSDLLTPSTTNKQGSYRFSNLSGQVFNGAGTAGTLNSGDLTVDFTDQSVDIQLGALLGAAQWNATGSGAITDLASANLALTGQREEAGVAEVASGSLGGQFVGSSYDGLMGYFDLATSSDQISGNYLFDTIDTSWYLDDALEFEQESFVGGYAWVNGELKSMTSSTLWLNPDETSSEGEFWSGNKTLKAFSVDDVVYVSISENSDQNALGSTPVNQFIGHWGQEWYQIQGGVVSSVEQWIPVTYVYSAITQENIVPWSGEGIGHYWSDEMVLQAGNGDVLNQDVGSSSTLLALGIDFSNNSVGVKVDLDLEMGHWSLNGSGSIESLQDSSIELVGTYIIAETGVSESAQGNVGAGIAGVDDYEVGHGSLYLQSESDSLFGVYAIDGYRSEPVGFSAGKVLIDGVASELSGYSLFKVKGYDELSVVNNEGYHYVDMDIKDVALDDGSIYWASGGVHIAPSDELVDVVYEEYYGGRDTYQDVYFVYTDNSTDVSTIDNKLGRYQYNYSGGENIYNSVTTGSLIVDFDQDTIDLSLEIKESGDWQLDGSGSIGQMQSGELPLSGYYTENADPVDAIGQFQGDFAGSNADGVFGFFNAQTNQGANGLEQDDLLIYGVHVFNNPSALDPSIPNNFRDNLIKQDDLRYGYILKGSEVFDLSDYERWNDSVDLKALVGEAGSQWVANDQEQREVLWATDNNPIIFGIWNDWYDLSTSELINNQPILYAHALTSDSGYEAYSHDGPSVYSVYSYIVSQDGTKEWSENYSSIGVDLNRGYIDITLDFANEESDWTVEGNGDLSVFLNEGISLAGNSTYEDKTSVVSGVIKGDFNQRIMGLGYAQLNDEYSDINSTWVMVHEYSGYLVEQDVKYIVSDWYGYDSSDVVLYGYPDSLDFIYSVAEDGYLVGTEGSTESEELEHSFSETVIGAWYETRDRLADRYYTRVPLLYVYSSIGNDLTNITSGLMTYDLDKGLYYSRKGIDDYEHGQLVSGILTVDFSQATLDAHFELESSTDYWSFGGNGSINALQNGSFTLTGQKSELADSSQVDDLSGSLNGEFIGSNAEGVIGSFDVTATTNEQIQGVFAVSQVDSSNNGGGEGGGPDLEPEPDTLTGIGLSAIQLNDTAATGNPGSTTLAGFESNSSEDKHEYTITSSGDNAVNSFDDLTSGVSFSVDDSAAESQLTLNAADYTLEFADGSTQAFTSDSGSNQVRPLAGDSGLDETTASANVYWGTWADSSSEQTAVHSNQFINALKLAEMHYIHADVYTSESTVLAKTGTAEYMFAGGTSPSRVNADGSVTLGQVESFNMSVDFTNQTLDTLLELTVGSDQVSASANAAAVANLLNQSGISLQVNDGSGSDLSGLLRGQFVGDDAQGVINVYNLQSTNGDISGAAFLQQTK